MSATGHVLALVNGHRRDAGLPPLAGDPKLARAALRRANALARAGRLDAHRGWLAALGRVGFPWRTREVGENIANGQDTAAEVVAAWMASPGHRANILHSRYRRVGVGVAEGFGARFWVQEFAS